MIAVVTGASRGAGRGIAHDLGAAGATVYVTGRSTRERELVRRDWITGAGEGTRTPTSCDTRT